MAGALDGEDKSSFLAKAMMESLPSGDKLNEMATGYLKSIEGVRMVLIDALKKDQPNIEKELEMSTLMSQESAKVQTVIKFVTGRSDKKSSGPLEKETESE